MLRPLVYEFQEQQALHRVDDELMVGPFLLIAPVLEPGATARRVLLPAGRWTELESGAIYEGPATVEVSVDPPPHVVTSGDACTMQWPLTLAGAGLARESVRLPRGEWFFYNYSRGGWTTVETWAGCAEASNRYGFGAAHPVRADTVAAWRDGCPP